MTEAGQLSMDEAIWHHGRVWWQVMTNSLGEVIFADEPEQSDGQVRGLVLQPHDEVERAGEAVERIKRDLHDANRRMCVRRGGTGWDMAKDTARRCERELAALEGAGFSREVKA